MDTAFLIKFFGALFAIMNPFVNLPIFLSLTAGRSPGEMRATALSVAFFSAIMCVVVAVAGTQILTFFGVSVDDFRLAGGLVLLLIALGMLNGHDSTAHTGTAKEQEHHAELDNVAFYPITFPMIVGPGTIATLVVFRGQLTTQGQHLAYWAALAAILAILGVVLFSASSIGRHMSQTLRVIMTRLMGMILAAIAAEMIVGGLKALLPGLA
ncbi:MAG: MarC family protein [Rhodobacteraceae bacterium]|nr:MarC family protein [Paracoccaceae bacterium]